MECISNAMTMMIRAHDDVFNSSASAEVGSKFCFDSFVVDYNKLKIK